ncbi:MAG TPA: inositol monophosphatase family protein [Candidatus Acidoferrales bacterium]|nr:inositol monophosphatase family protein [Candidatus Acidoferrales bacterium]
MSEYLDAAMEIAREAGVILREGFDRPKEISYKGEVDLVTESDRRSEQWIVARLQRRFPDHGIVAEESGVARPVAEFCWHVDPLDGTTNFAHGYPCFAVSIGLAKDGVPIAGAIFNPVSNELFAAARGEGAYRNDDRIRVSSVERLATSLVATGFPTHQRKKSSNINYYWQFTLRSHGVRRDGAAALDLCSVACGRFDAFWEFGLKSWDTTAGIVIVEEAGGRITDLAGQPYRLGGPSIFASNQRIHLEVLEVAARIAEDAANDT